jgi:hypothetical protein
VIGGLEKALVTDRAGPGRALVSRDLPDDSRHDRQWEQKGKRSSSRGWTTTAYFFLPATVLRAPRRVLALVRVR